MDKNTVYASKTFDLNCVPIWCNKSYNYLNEHSAFISEIILNDKINKSIQIYFYSHNYYNIFKYDIVFL